MNIAILTTVHPPLDVRIFYKQAISLADAGFNITLFAPFDPRASSIIEQKGIKYVPLKGSIRRSSRPIRWLQLMDLLKTFQADVWHFHDPELLPLAIFWRALFKRKVKLIYDVHEDVPKDTLDKPWIIIGLRKPVSKVVDWIEKWGIGRCDLVIAATDSIADRAKTVARNVFTVHNYPLTNEVNFLARESKRGDPIRILYAGTIIKSRGIREIVQAMAYVSDCPVELLLLGEFYPTSFESEIRAISGANVIIKGKVPFDKMPKYFQQSDIGIVCFHPLPNHIEAMPNKLFEYMQAGLAVIASNFPLWKKIVEGVGSGLLVDPQDPKQIAAAIRQLVSHPEICQEMGNAGERAVSEWYSWQSEVKILLEAYSQLHE